MNDTTIGIKIIMCHTEMGFEVDELSFYEFNIKSRVLFQLFDVPDIGCISDSLSQALIDSSDDTDCTLYDYHIDFEKKKVTLHEYDPFKPLSSGYKDSVKKYNIKYTTKTIIDSW
jgi:hypothetical protein